MHKSQFMLTLKLGHTHFDMLNCLTYNPYQNNVNNANKITRYDNQAYLNTNPR